MPTVAAESDRPTGIDVLHRYLASVAADSDIDELMEMFTEDAVLEMPYHPDEAARVLDGRDAIRARVAISRKLFSRISFFDIVIRRTDDEATFVLEYGGDGESTDGKVYRNRYCVIAQLRDGRLALWREYFNPAIRDSALS